MTRKLAFVSPGLVLICLQAVLHAEQPKIAILDTRFEPLREGKNVLHVDAQNDSPKDECFAVHVQTKATDSRPPWGWGTVFFETVRAGQKARVRVPYKIYSPLTDATSIRVQYYNPPSREAYDFDAFFKQIKHTARDLPRAAASASQPAAPDEEAAALDTWRAFQDHLRNKAHAKAWEMFTADLKTVDFFDGCGTKKDAMKSFGEAMDLPVTFWWSRSELLAIEPQSVSRFDDGLLLSTAMKNQPVLVRLIRAQQQWKIDSIGNFTPTPQWKDRLLPLMRKRASERFDVYVLPGSTAQKEIDEIVERREAAFGRVSQFAEKVPSDRICVILFEDRESKQRVTGHQGDGWAFDQTVVEVYNPSTRLDPAHEIAHIVMGNVGSPPALFNEGLAVSMQADHEWQGESVHSTAARLASADRLTPLDELIARTEIGARKDDGQIAYPEAASFVTFLIDRHGTDRFLQAYRTLQNSGKPLVRMSNASRIERIYGKPLSALEAEWRAELKSTSSKPS